jgi:hypothetical protein
MVGFTTGVHVVRRPEFVWASVATVTSVWCTGSLIVLGKPLVEGSQISFLRRWCKILFSVFWWPATIGINDMHQLGVTALTIIVARRPWGFIWLLRFSLMLKLAEVLDLRLPEFCELFVELRHYFWPLPD